MQHSEQGPKIVSAAGTCAARALPAWRPARAAWVVLLAGMWACATTVPGGKRRPSWAKQATQAAEPLDEDAARGLWHDARAAAAAGDGNTAQRKEAELRRAFPTSEAAAWAYEAGANRAALDGNTALELSELEHVLYLRPHYGHIARVREAYASRLVHEQRIKDALAMVQHVEAGPERNRLGTALLAPLVATGNGQAAIELAVQMAQGLQGTEAEQKRLQNWALEVGQAQLGFNDIDRLWAAHATDPAYAFLQPLLALRLAKIYFHIRHEDKAEALLQDLLRRFPNSAYAEPARHFAALIAARFEVAPRAVGVILPLSGRFQPYGERSLAAIRLAFARAPHIKLVVKDTASEPTQAAQALETMVLHDHIVAAIGPLTSEEATSAAFKAEELGLPLLSLSYREGLTDVGRNVFRTGLTVAAQAKALAALAFDGMGMRTFAFLAPKSRYGQDFVQAFWDEVDARQGEIRGMETYAPEQTTFREPVRRLVGRWYLNARPEFRDALKALKERELSGLKMRVEVDRLDKRSAPIVDFDGLIIPDSGRQVGLIAPAIAFEDVVLTQDSKTLERMRQALGQEDLRPITLMGASTWNSQLTLDSCEQYCEGAVFVDGYFAGSHEVRVRDFVAGFQAEMHSEPFLTEAQAYDSAGMLLRVLEGTKELSRREQVVDGLLALKDYPGVCGRSHFTPAGEVVRELVPLTIRRHRIEVLKTATRATPARAARP